MVAGSKFNITITALDKATAVINKINKKMAEANAPVKKFGTAIKDFNKESGITRMVKGLDETGKAAEKVARSVARIIAPMATVFGAGSVGAVAAMADHLANAAHKVLLTGQNTNMTTKQIQGLQGAMRMMGVDTDTTAGALQGFGQLLQDAKWGRNEPMRGYFHGLGLDIGEAADRVRNEGDVLLDFADKVKALEDKGDHAGALKMLDLTGLQALGPALMLGRAGIEQMRKDHDRLNPDRNPGQLAVANKFFMSTNAAKESILGLWTAIANKLIPVLSPLVDKFTNFVAANRDLIATKITHFIEKLGDALQNINWTDLFASIGTTLRAVNSLIVSMGGWGRTIEGLIVVMNFGLIVHLAKLAKGIGSVALSIVTLFVPALITSIRLFGELTLAMLACPLTWMVIGAAAVGAALGLAARYAIDHWKEFEMFMKRMWDRVVEHARKAFHLLRHLNPFNGDGDESDPSRLPGIKYDGEGNVVGSTGTGFAIGMGPYQPGGASPTNGLDGSNGTVDVNVTFNGKPSSVSATVQKTGRVNVETAHNHAFALSDGI